MVKTWTTDELNFKGEDDGYVVLHTHFDCPICGKDYAPTSEYGEIEDCTHEFECENCGTCFERTEENPENWKISWISPSDMPGEY